MRFKYVMTENNGAILFSGLLKHSQFARGFGEITSAGFCFVTDEEITCFGESISLGIEHDKEDGAKITRQLNY